MHAISFDTRVIKVNLLTWFSFDARIICRNFYFFSQRGDLQLQFHLINNSVITVNYFLSFRGFAG